MKTEKLREHNELLSGWKDEYTKEEYLSKNAKRNSEIHKQKMKTIQSRIVCYFEHNPELKDLLIPKRLEGNIEQGFLSNGFVEGDFYDAIENLKQLLKIKE
ncbi:MAG: hypothetical protein P4L28_01645 [Paludibacteraceae bacterium]|nr:hypothetical protein [Paludibacteraceae bacterium]